MSTRWNINNLDEGFIKPQKSVGPVLVNGRISRGLVAIACSNRKPYWPMPEGQYRDDVGFTRRGDIAYTIISKNNSIDCVSNNPQQSRKETSSVKAITALSGQGDITENNHDIMTRIQVQGIIEMPTDDNHKELFNIMTGGIHTVRNNSPYTIKVGDWVMAYAPSREEALKTAGGLQTNAEKAGLVKLWFKPYRPEIHKNQLNQIYNCLVNNDDDTKPYLDSYKRHCNQFMDSVLGMSAVILSVMLPELKKMDKNISTEEVLAALMEKAGHTDFKKKKSYMNNRSVNNLYNKSDMYTEIVNKLFTPFSVNSLGATPLLYPTQDNETKIKLNTLQQQSTSQFLESTAVFVNTINNLIMGNAKSTGGPGKDFSIELSGYSKKG